MGQLCDLAVTQFYALSDKQRQAISVSQGGVAKWYRQQIQSQFARYQADGSVDAQAAHQAVADQVAALVKELDKVAADGAKKVAQTGAAGRASMDTQVGQVLAAVHGVCTAAVNEFRSTVVPAYEAAHEAGTVAVLDFVAKLEAAKQHAMGPATPVLVPDTPSGGGNTGTYDPKSGEHVMEGSDEGWPTSLAYTDPTGFDSYDTTSAWATLATLTDRVAALKLGNWGALETFGVNAALAAAGPLGAAQAFGVELPFLDIKGIAQSEVRSVREILDDQYADAVADVKTAANRRLAYINAKIAAVKVEIAAMQELLPAVSGVDYSGGPVGPAGPTGTHPEIHGPLASLGQTLAGLEEEGDALGKLLDNVEGFGWDEAGEVAHTGLALAAIVGSPWVTVGALATDSAIYAAEGDELGAILAGAGALAGVAKIAAQSEGLSATLAKGGDVIDDLLGGIKKAGKWLKTGSLPRPTVSEPRLASLVDELYRPGAVYGTGSTADAVRYELKTGILLSKHGHSEKARIFIKALNNWLYEVEHARIAASELDIAAAKALIDDMERALEGY